MMVGHQSGTSVRPDALPTKAGRIQKACRSKGTATVGAKKKGGRRGWEVRAGPAKSK